MLGREAYVDVTEMFSDDSMAKRSCHRVCAISVLLAQISTTWGPVIVDPLTSFVRVDVNRTEKPFPSDIPTSYSRGWQEQEQSKNVLKKATSTGTGLEMMLQSKVERVRTLQLREEEAYRDLENYLHLLSSISLGAPLNSFSVHLCKQLFRISSGDNEPTCVPQVTKLKHSEKCRHAINILQQFLKNLHLVCISISLMVFISLYFYWPILVTLTWYLCP